MLLFYNLSTRLYFTSVRIATLFNSKAKKMIEGRRAWKNELNCRIDKSAKYIWVHCASLGEFEQGRPLIEEIKQNNPNNYKIILTFFSPSGYEIRKNYELADNVCYLPFDTKKNAIDFVKIVNPVYAVFVKYEIWYHMLSELFRNNIPVFLVSGIFRKNQIFFKYYGKSYRKALSFFKEIFLQDKESQEILKNVGITNTDVCGDTRTDRVISIANGKYENNILEKFSANKKCMVCGSTWPADEKLLCDLINNSTDDFRFIIAPHEITERHLKSIELMLNVKTDRLSKIDGFTTDLKVIIVDSIGILSKIYRYAQIAYIGGGFGQGIHNILEASVYEIPVAFGPNYKKFREACDLVKINAAFSINTIDELKSIVNNVYSDSQYYKKIQEATKHYITASFGATQHIFNKMQLIVENRTV